MAQGSNPAPESGPAPPVSSPPDRTVSRWRPDARTTQPLSVLPGPYAKPSDAAPEADPAPAVPEPADGPGEQRTPLPVLTDCGRLHHQMQVLVEQAPHMIIVYELRDGTIRFANTATSLLLGRRPGELVGANVFDLLTVPDGADPTHSDPDSPSLFPGEYPARLPDGSVHYLDVRSAPVIFDGVRCGHVVAWDVTTRVERERDLIRQASYDELTGLPNAAHAFVYLEQSLRRLERSGTGCVAVILIDLDGFKQVNDTHGHQTGDVLLQETASRIRATTRDTDLAARLHGDEFLVVQSVANPIHAAYVSERLRTVLANPIDIDGLTVRVSASVGVAVADPGSTDPHHLLQFADHRMYTDKQRRAHRR